MENYHRRRPWADRPIPPEQAATGDLLDPANLGKDVWLWSSGNLSIASPATIVKQGRTNVYVGGHAYQPHSLRLWEYDHGRAYGSDARGPGMVCATGEAIERMAEHDGLRSELRELSLGGMYWVPLTKLREAVELLRRPS